MASAKSAKLPIRTATALVISSIGIVALMIAVALISTSTQLERSVMEVVRDTQSSATANELGVALLTYQRLSNLHYATRDPALVTDRDGLERQMQELIEAARSTIGSESERQLLERLAVSLQTYILERRRLESGQLEIESLLTATQPTLEQTLAHVEALRDLNDEQVRRTRAQALRINDTANIVGAAAGTLLALSLLMIALATRRAILYPLLALHSAIARFRAGEHSARADRGGLREIDELSRNFNEMADTLGAQRDSQLAFLAGVAHDLRNPLHAMKMGIFSLAHERSETRRNQARERLDRLVDRLGRMVEDLLDATRIEAGRLELQPEQFDLRASVEDVVELYATATAHRMAVHLPAEAVLVHADPLRIEQVIGNLLSNAIKYSPEGGAIDIEVAADAHSASLTVRDWGIGIPEEEIEAIFLPFRRCRGHSVPGTGLGLSVVRRIVQAHLGEITVSSQPGLGSTFRVSLPLANAGRAALPPPTSAELPPAPSQLH